MMRERGGETPPFMVRSEVEAVATIGTHHHVAGPCPPAYAGEMAWREDRRRVSSGEQHLMMTEAASRHPASRAWKGYRRRAARRKPKRQPAMWGCLFGLWIVYD